MPPEFVNTKAFPPTVTERPILFSAPMVRALLDGSKTQTRRPMKPQPALKGRWMAWEHKGVLVTEQNVAWSPFSEGFPRALANPGLGYLCPYGRPGERLWVRETFGSLETDGVAPEWSYRADMHDDALPPRWTPSIHMPRRASRINLEVTGVRVEHLQDISAADAKAEGIEGQSDDGPWRNYGRDGYWFPEGKDTAPVLSYRSLWEQINGPDSWASNPWVWVVDFRRIKP